MTSFELQKVSESTVAVVDENLASNAGAIILDDCIIAVDATMMPDTSKMFRKMLEETFNLPVKYLCVTHYHGDHVFGFKPFKDVTMFGSSRLGENLQRRIDTDWSPQALAKEQKENPAEYQWLEDVELFIPPILFHNEIEIVIQNKSAKFYHSGGHTNCSVYGYYAEEKILFAADLLFSEMVPYAGDITCDPEDWMKALQDWLQMDIEKVIPGHGPVTDLEEVKKQLTFFEQLRAATFDAINAGKTYQEIVFPEVYSDSKVEAEDWLVKNTKERWFEYYSQNLNA
jgi:glyoxylase-like metal-dependent hydrolase (beta-lactamase superfamily II)